MGAISPGVRALAGLRQAAGAWLWDIPGERLYADARFANLTGLDPDEALAGLPTDAFYRGVAADDLLRLKIAVAGVMHGADMFNRVFRVKDHDGVVRWVSAKGGLERDEAGAAARFTGVLADITEQKKIEEQLQVAQHAGGVGSFEYLDGFGTVTVSGQFCRLLGLQPADALPVRTVNAVVHPDDPPLVQGPSQSSGIGDSYAELRIRRADTGEERWVARRGEHRDDGLARGGRFIGVIYDITDAKRTEGKLVDLTRTLEDRVAERTRERDRIWARSRDLFVVIEGGVYRAVNPAWTDLLGYSESELVGRPPNQLVHEDDRALAVAGYAGLLNGEPVENLDLRMMTKDGSFRWVNWTVIPEGEALYAIGRDVTERKELEQQLLQSQKMEAVGQLTGGIAHDFNNMLTAVIGGVQLATRRLSSGREADALRFLEAASESAQRAAGLTHRLLAFSRRQTLNPQPVDANALVAAMEDMLRRTLGEQVELVVDLSPILWTSRADANQLESAILNLAINARDAMQDGGRLNIVTRNIEFPAVAWAGAEAPPMGDYVAISVRDTGAGMPDAVKRKVFEPFFTTKPLGQGTGLGLSMVYGFVRQSGGHVDIDSAPGHGTTVTLYLPRTTDEGVRQDARPPRESPPVGRGQTILLVEDQAEVRSLMRGALTDLNYKVIEAASGPDALQILEDGGEIEALISDVGLPGLTGPQLAERLRETRPDLPVLFVTGYVADAGPDLLQPGVRLLTKPFQLDTFATVVGEMLA